MTKFIGLFIYLMSSIALGQINAIRPDVIETVSTYKNYVKNPSARINTLGTSVSSASITRDTSAGNTLEGIGSFICNSASQNGYCLWSLNTIQHPDQSGMCEFTVSYKGDGTKYNLRITDTSSTIQDGPLLSNVSVWTEASVIAACGSARDVRFFQSASGDGAAVNIGRVYYGKVRAIPNVLTAAGSLIYSDAYKRATELPGGTVGQTLRYKSGAPIWTDDAPKQYIANPDAEADTDGWTTYADAAGAVPVDCTGGTPNSTWTASASSPIRGAKSFLWTHNSGASRQGEGAAYAFTLDSADQGSAIQVKFDWVLSSGTWAGSVTPGTPSDVIVYLYDVTNGRRIEPVSRLLEPAVTGVNYTYTSSFQPDSNASSFRLCLHNATSSTSAFVLKLDSFVVGRNKAQGVIPKAMTVQTFLSGTSQTYTTPAGVKWLKVRMIGGGGGGQGSGTSGRGSGGAGGATTFSSATAGGGTGGSDSSVAPGGTGSGCTFSITGGNSTGSFTAGSETKGNDGGASPFGGTGSGGARGGGGNAAPANTGGGGGGGGIGAANVNVGSGGGGGAYCELVIPNPSPTYTYTVGTAGTAGSAGTSGFVGGAGGSGRIDVEEYYVGTNVLMSNETDTRVVVANYAASGSNSVASGGNTTIVWDTRVVDTHSGMETSTGVFTVPVNGNYRISSQLTLDSAAWGAANQNLTLNLYRNGSLARLLCYKEVGSTSSHSVSCNGSTILSLNAGDTIELRESQNSGGSRVLAGGVNYNWISIDRVSGPSIIAASESVNFLATATGGQSFTSGVEFTLSYNSVTFDSHGAFSSNTTYTCPISGKYQISAMFTYLPTGSTSGTSRIRLYKNGAIFKSFVNSFTTVATGAHALAVNSLASCNAGDTFQVRGLVDQGSWSVSTDGTLNTFSIVRVGN